MCDIMVLGFQTDTTRICTLKLNNDHSSLRFPNLGVDYMIHHLLSHSDTADWLKVNQFSWSKWPTIARKLESIQEGPGRRWTNNADVCSSMLTGNHDANQLPVVMLGGAGGRIKGGRVLDYKEKPDRQMCRLYLSMMEKMSVRLPKFGMRRRGWRKSSRIEGESFGSLKEQKLPETKIGYQFNPQFDRLIVRIPRAVTRKR
jgi:hypothetical protein